MKGTASHDREKRLNTSNKAQARGKEERDQPTVGRRSRRAHAEPTPSTSQAEAPPTPPDKKKRRKQQTPSRLALTDDLPRVGVFLEGFRPPNAPAALTSANGKPKDIYLTIFKLHL